MFDDLLSKFTGGDDNSNPVEDGIQSVIPDVPEMPEMPQQLSDISDAAQNIPGIGQEDEE